MAAPTMRDLLGKAKETSQLLKNDDSRVAARENDGISCRIGSAYRVMSLQLYLAAQAPSAFASRSRWWRTGAKDTGVFPPPLWGRVREGGGGKRRTRMNPQLERAEFAM